MAKVPMVAMCLSIHDLTRRSTEPSTDETVSMAPFNSRPHKEVDCRAWHGLGAGRPFNSRPHKEVDSKHSQYFFIFASIIYSFIQIILLFLIFLFKISSHFTYYPLYTRCESPDIFCPLRIRTKGSTSQSHQNWVLFQYALLCFYIYLPDYKIADCPIPCL